MPDLTCERLRELLHYNPRTGVFKWRVDGYRKTKAGDVAGCFSHGYWQIGIQYRGYRAHRLAWLYMTGEWPPAQIDHKDRDRANNKWTNLRLATNVQNARNTLLRSHNTSGVTGVSWREDKQRWRARIHVEGREHVLGSFMTRREATIARRAAEKKHFGTFAPRIK